MQGNFEGGNEVKKILFAVLLAAMPLVVFASQGTGSEPRTTSETGTKASTSASTTHHARRHRKRSKNAHHVKRHHTTKQHSQTQ